MQRRSLLACFAALAAALGSAPAHANTIGLLESQAGTIGGYTLFTPEAYPHIYLIDNNGELVHKWTQNTATAEGYYLAPNGHIIHAAQTGDPWFPVPGSGGKLQDVDWDDNVVWEWVYSDSTHRLHHDIEVLPNGNILSLAFEYKDMAECLAAGRDPALLPDGDLFPDHVIEVRPVGADSAVIVWEWHVWDHLVQDFDPTKANYGVVEDHPELVDINFVANGNGGHDWNHMNAIDYNAALDQIVVSVNIFSEWWIIDHSTTTAEAAGHTGGNQGKGGDLLYRWGNPQAYRRGTPADQHDWRQHNVQWIPSGFPGAGNILFYNNGNGRPAGAYSSVEEVITPVDSAGGYPALPAGVPYGPDTAAVIITATPPDSMYSPFISGAQRLPNGNTLVCEGRDGVFWEFDTSGNVVWKYVNPVNRFGPMVQNTLPSGNAVFRCTRFAPSYQAFEGRDLTPQGVIELPPVGVEVAIGDARFLLRQNYPNPFRPFTTIPFSLGTTAVVKLDVYDVAGRRVDTLVQGRMGAGAHNVTWEPRKLPAGVYQVRLSVDGRTATRQMVLLR